MAGQLRGLEKRELPRVVWGDQVYSRCRARSLARSQRTCTYFGKDSWGSKCYYRDDESLSTTSSLVSSAHFSLNLKREFIQPRGSTKLQHWGTIQNTYLRNLLYTARSLESWKFRSEAPPTPTTIKALYKVFLSIGNFVLCWKIRDNVNGRLSWEVELERKALEGVFEIWKEEIVTGDGSSYSVDEYFKC